jgi:5-methylcytosine-specific restriction endonuclease McrA
MTTKEWKEKHKARHSELNKKSARKYPERIKARNAAYYQKHREECDARQKVWMKSHPETRKIHNSLRRTRLTKAGGTFTVKQWKALCTVWMNKCLCCGKKRRLTPDHIIPVVKGGTSNISNIQPLCGPCNSAKGIKSTDYRELRRRAT